MPTVCGIELKSSEAILVVVESTIGSEVLIDTEPKKIKIGNDEHSPEVRSFFDAFVHYIRDNNIDLIVLKSRAKKGRMAGGPVSFKLEALIQLNGIVDSAFVRIEPRSNPRKSRNRSMLDDHDRIRGIQRISCIPDCFIV